MDDVKYYAMLGSERVGPMSLDELRNLNLTPNTPVWRTGMPDWANASTFPELASYFEPRHQAYPPYNNIPNPSPNPSYAAGGNNYYGQPYGNNGPLPPRPNNYLVWSILVTVLCCLVGGIVALVYSSKVNTCYDRGDYEGAVSASNTARTWCIVSAIVGFLGSAIYTGAILFGALGELF